MKLEALEDDVLVLAADDESMRAAVALRKDVASSVHRTMHMRIVSKDTMQRLEVMCMERVSPLLRQVGEEYAASLTFDDEFGQVLVVLDSLGELEAFFALVDRSWQGQRLERVPVAWLDGIARGLLRDLVAPPDTKMVPTTKTITTTSGTNITTDLTDEKRWPNLAKVEVAPKQPAAKPAAIGAHVGANKDYALWSSFPAVPFFQQPDSGLFPASCPDFSYFNFDVFVSDEFTVLQPFKVPEAQVIQAIPSLEKLVSMLSLGDLGTKVKSTESLLLFDDQDLNGLHLKRGPLVRLRAWVRAVRDECARTCGSVRV